MDHLRGTIDIVIPCHNEEPNILALVNEIDRHFAGSKFVHNYIFVDE